MRRISAVVLTTGAMAAGLLVAASPASAAPGPVSFQVTESSGALSASDGSVESAAAPKWKKWKARNSLPRVAGSGTWRKGPRFMITRGVNSDGGQDGFQACLRFKATKPGHKPGYLVGCVVDKRTGRAVDRVAAAKLRIVVPHGQHLYVQEARRSMRNGKYQFARRWTKIF